MSLCANSISRSFTKTSIILMLISIALLLFNTLESIKIPCSVKAYGRYFVCAPCLKVANCDLKISFSSLVSSNIKCAGNLSRFLFTSPE